MRKERKTIKYLVTSKPCWLEWWVVKFLKTFISLRSFIQLSIKAVEGASTMHSRSTTQKKASENICERRSLLYIVAQTALFPLAAQFFVGRHQFDIDNNSMFDSQSNASLSQGGAPELAIRRWGFEFFFRKRPMFVEIINACNFATTMKYNNVKVSYHVSHSLFFGG